MGHGGGLHDPFRGRPTEGHPWPHGRKPSGLICFRNSTHSRQFSIRLHSISLRRDPETFTVQNEEGSRNSISLMEPQDLKARNQVPISRASGEPECDSGVRAAICNELASHREVRGSDWKTY